MNITQKYQTIPDVNTLRNHLMLYAKIDFCSVWRTKMKMVLIITTMIKTGCPVGIIFGSMMAAAIMFIF